MMDSSRFLTALAVLFLCGVQTVAGQTGGLPPELQQAIQNSQQLLGQQKFEEAEAELLAATEKFQAQPAAWYFLGYARHAQKDYASAMTAYQKAVDLAAGRAPNALYNMACIHSVRGEKDEAFARLDAAVNAGFQNMSLVASDAELENLKDDPRFEKFEPKWLPDEDIFVEQTSILQQWVGETQGDQFGWTGRRAGDLDGDGAEDVVLTAPTYAQGSGKIYVYSSKSGALLFEVEGQAGERLGNSAVGIGDVDGDGTADVVAGAPMSAGKGAAYVYSGKDGAVLHALKGHVAAGQFGYEVSALPDIDGDSVPDFLVGAICKQTKPARPGMAVLYSGRTGEQLIALEGERPSDSFGNAAAAARIDSATVLLAIGAPDAGPKSRGRVYVYRISQGKAKPAFVISGNEQSVDLGKMFISFPGDLDQDQVPDVYAADFSDNSSVAGGGKVVVHSGSDGRELLALQGAKPREGFGTSPSDAGDVDGDGIGDLVVGAWQNPEGASSGGKVSLYSAAGNGRLLRSWTCKQAGDTLGFDACGIGDVNGDGFVDFLLTSAWSNAKGAKTGRVFIVAGEDFTQRARSPEQRRYRAGEVSTVLDGIEAGTGGLNIDRDGTLYTADFGWRLDGKGKGGNRVYRVSQEGEAEVFCESLKGASGNTFDAAGNLFQSNIGGNSISKISPSGTESKFCEVGLFSPVGLAFNSSQDLFVCNCGNNTIQRITPKGESSVFCRSSLLKCPNGIAVGPDDVLYVCNFGNGDVVQISPDGRASLLATLPGKNNGHLIYHEGFLYVLARTDCRVYQVDLAGRVSVFAGSGERGKQDGKAFESSLSLPNSLIVSPDGRWLFVNETSPITGDPRVLGPTRIRRIEMIPESR